MAEPDKASARCNSAMTAFEPKRRVSAINFGRTTATTHLQALKTVLLGQSCQSFG